MYKTRDNTSVFIVTNVKYLPEIVNNMPQINNVRYQHIGICCL